VLERLDIDKDEIIDKYVFLSLDLYPDQLKTSSLRNEDLTGSSYPQANESKDPIQPRLSQISQKPNTKGTTRGGFTRQPR
jgi:hypothetical protein